MRARKTKTKVAPKKPETTKSRLTGASALRLLARAAEKKTRNLTDKPTQLFQAYQPPPGVLPNGVKPMAMDDATQSALMWAQSSLGAYWSEGLTFMGYAYLSELTLRPEYRVMSQVIATEMTRKWIKFEAAGDEDKTDQIKELENEFTRLCVRDVFYKLAEMDGWMGRTHLYLDTGATDDRPELLTDIGDGLTKASDVKFKRGDLRRITMVEPVWTYPQNYNATDPLHPNWYKPDTWFVMGKQVHASRLLTFIGRPVPDVLKPAYAFGGLSLSQIAKPYVDNWLQTRQSVNDIIRAFSVMVLQTDLSSMVSSSDESGLPGEGSSLFNRLDLFNLLRDNRGIFAIDKEGEDFKNVSAPLGTLDTLQAQSQEHMASVSRIPIVKLLGISPAGLNASSEGELKAFYDTINSFQEFFFRPHLTVVSRFAQRNIWGDVDEDITFKFNDLWAMDELQAANVRKTEAETDDILVNGVNAITPAESRKRVAGDASTPYAGLDADDVPEPVEEPDDPKINIRGTEPFKEAAE